VQEPLFDLLLEARPVNIQLKEANPAGKVAADFVQKLMLKFLQLSRDTRRRHGYCPAVHRRVPFKHSGRPDSKGREEAMAQPGGGVEVPGSPGVALSLLSSTKSFQSAMIELQPE
jgi:hypothetical protein